MNTLLTSFLALAGNYRSAHDVLVQLYQDLRHEGLTVPSEFKANLTLLHIYTLVRVHVRKGNHLNAARLLIKVAANISKFPAREYFVLLSEEFVPTDTSNLVH